MPFESSLGLRKPYPGMPCLIQEACKTLFGLVHFYPPEIFLFPCPSSLFSHSFFSSFCTAQITSWAKILFPFLMAALPSWNRKSENWGRVTPRWRDPLPQTLFHSLLQGGPFCISCLDPPFLLGWICSSMQGEGERSLGGATLIALRNLPAIQGHWGKPGKKKLDRQKEKLLPKIVIESLLDYLEHLNFAYKCKTKQVFKLACLDQFDIWMETDSVPLGCQNIWIKSEKLCQ